MKAKKIYNSDIDSILISSLPSRPTAPSAQGGAGFSARNMKEAFDKLPLFIIERYNRLIDDVKSIGEDSLAGAMPTGIKEEHTLNALFEDIASGELATYFSICGKSLFSHIVSLWFEIDALKEQLCRIEEENKEEK